MADIPPWQILPRQIFLKLEKFLRGTASRKRLIVLIVLIAAFLIWIPNPPLIDIRGTWDFRLFGALEISVPHVMSDWNLAQIFINSIFAGSTYVLLAVGLTLVYRILKFANFAHAEFVTFGAYMAFLAFEAATSIGIDIGTDLFWGVMIAFFLTGLLGVASDKTVFGPLRRRNAEGMTIMISSIGVGLIIRHLIQEVWTAESKFYEARLPEWIPEKINFFNFFEFPLLPVQEGTYDYLLFQISAREAAAAIAYDFKFNLFGSQLCTFTTTPIKLFVMLSSFLLVLACHFVFTRTKLGKAMRATSDNPDLAQAAGIDINRVITLVWFLGAGLAGAGGILSLVAIRRINPDTGFKLLLFAFAVVILGGIGSFYGAILAAFIVGFAENYGVYFLMGMQEKYPMFSDSLYESEPKLVFLALLLIHSLFYSVFLLFVVIKEREIKHMKLLTMGQYMLTSSLILILDYRFIINIIERILDQKSNVVEYIYELFKSTFPFTILVLVLPLFYGVYLARVDVSKSNTKYVRSLTIGHLIVITCLILKVGFPIKIASLYQFSFSGGYKPAIAFAILIITLLFRPRGLMGLPEEAGKEE